MQQSLMHDLTSIPICGTIIVPETARPITRKEDTFTLHWVWLAATGLAFLAKQWSSRGGIFIMARKLIEIGTRFGRLVVLEQAEHVDHTHRYYKCRCDCGTVFVTRRSSLRNDLRACKSCAHRKLIEIGTRFGKLVTVERADDLYGETAYKCQCDCGNVIAAVSASNLRKGQKGCNICARRLLKGEAGFNKLLGGYKAGAKKRGLAFELTKDEFRKLVTSDCAYCGNLPSSVAKARFGDFTHNGVDRMDNDLGYVSSNVVPCCKWCNPAKQARDYNEWIAWLDQVAKFRTSRRR